MGADPYRQPTADELQVFADHFGRRRVELGDCVRPYGSGCTHEHACIRCNFLHVHTDAAARLANIEQDLQQRLEEASTQQWLADVEQLRVTLRRLQDKKTTLGRGEAQPRGLQGFTVHPPLDVPAAADHVGVYNPPHHL